MALEKKARQPELQSELRNWVGAHVAGKNLEAKWATMTTGFSRFGVFSVDNYFPWPRLDIKEPAWPTLIGPVRAADLGRPETFKSVYFGADDTVGVLVKLPGSPDFGLEDFKDSFRPVADDIVVYCYERD